METLPFTFSLAAALFAYALWFHVLAKMLTSPRVWPLVGNLSVLFENRRQIHDWIASNLRATSRFATNQTCTIALPFLAWKQGFYIVTCHPKNIEHILKTWFDNYPKGPHMQDAFHDLLGKGIFNSDGETWLIQRKTAALEFMTWTLRQTMARWVNRTIKDRLWCILDKARNEKTSVDLQDLLLRLTFDNICGLAFGKDPETLSPELHVILLEKVLGIGAKKRQKSSLEIIGNYMDVAIETRRKDPSDDVLSRFMKKKRDDRGNLFTSDNLQHIALNFVLAGRDTSSVALN
ncbi:Cytochrome P450 86A2 [Hibiscus syriacus]|uniref:Cytochrome P450 86A2 n=1 Tax=Hibiscus syriacus TaxID=106335 RepID=A0A6A2YI59_HIBSY|nr:Cytochrome P450 86A2 [Hibiscus syriacus]